MQRVGSFTYIAEGGVIHIHCRGWDHSRHGRGWIFTYIVEGGYIAEGGVMHIEWGLSHCRGWVIHLNYRGSFTYTEGGSFTYIAEGGVISEGGVVYIHCRGWGHSHTMQRVGSFTYIAEGRVIHIHCRGWGHFRGWVFTYIAEGGVIHIQCRGWGHSHTLHRVIHIHYRGSFTYISEGHSQPSIPEGGVIHIHCRGWGHSHTFQRVGCCEDN